MTAPQDLQCEASSSWYRSPQFGQVTFTFSPVVHERTIFRTSHGMSTTATRMAATVTHRPACVAGVMSPKPTVVNETTEK